MALTIYQKSVYLTIIHSTMALRSIGKTIKENNIKLSDFKKKVFKKLDYLTEKIDKNDLTEPDIIYSIEELNKEFKISFGQAQKIINVILKYHFYLTNNNNPRIKEILNCPVDSIILKKLKEEKISLSRIDKQKYLEIQEKIKKEKPIRIEFDKSWDEQHLESEGWL